MRPFLFREECNMKRILGWTLIGVPCVAVLGLMTFAYGWFVVGALCAVGLFVTSVSLGFMLLEESE
jgi:hypothetical protein